MTTTTPTVLHTRRARHGHQAVQIACEVCGCFRWMVISLASSGDTDLPCHSRRELTCG